MTDFSPIALLRFLALFLVQVFILNHIHWFGVVSPMVLVLSLYWTPIQREIMRSMLGAFALGLFTDIASDTLAFHTIALTVTAYIRPSLLRLSYGSSVSFHTDSQFNSTLAQNLLYLFYLVLIHHLLFFSIEIFEVREAFVILKKTAYHLPFSFLVAAMIVILFSPQKR
ncbi:MAG: hypothetical protein RLZZ242_578 [Bacteroidota bacterium]|jgi:rod shape-determining protein MreD